MQENIIEGEKRQKDSFFNRLPVGKFVVIWVVIIVIALVILLSFFLKAQDDNLKLAVDIRESVLQAVLEEKDILGDYESMIFAPSVAVYNTCTEEIKIFNDDFSWTRDWLYLRFFDSLHSEKVRSIKRYDANTKKLENSLYDTFSLDGFLPLSHIPGLNSYCTPYFILDKLEKSSGERHSRTHDLTRRLCSDFYSDAFLASACSENSLISNCVNDNEFYSVLEELLLDKTSSPEEIIDFYGYDTTPLGNLMIDGYIVGYLREHPNYVESINFDMLNAIAYFYDNQISSSLCSVNFESYSALLRAMHIKGYYLDDPLILEKHKNIQEELQGMCYSDYSELLGNHNSMADKIEFYYVLGDESLAEDLEILVDNTIEEELFTKSDGFRKYVFLDKEAKEDFDYCKDLRIDLSENLKNSLYILMYSIYGT